jgi:predicted ATPase
VALYRGDFLEGFYVRDAPTFEEWVLVQGTRLRELALQALHRLSKHYAEQGEVGLEDGIKYTSRLLALEPSREEAHRGLMLLLAQSGQRGAALAQYEVCRQALAEDLGVAPGPETQELHERIRDGEIGRQSTPPPSAGWSPDTTGIPHNLPPQPTPFVGREAELSDLDQLIADPDVRLITIVGPGGIGKTRLALAGAERQVSQFTDTQSPGTQGHPFHDGVYFAPLAAVSSVDQVITALASALEFQLSRDDTRSAEQQVLDYLRQKQMLLILDNLEHLLDSADIITDILPTAPGLQILATSRERLNLQQEQVFAIQGLEFFEWETLEEAQRYPATQLFVQSARRVQRDLELATADLPHLYRICRLAQGMPLALELAAAWVGNLSLADIAIEMQKSLDILTTDWRDVPDRHRSMRATFDTSWRCLSEAERDLFAQLCVFRGGFTRTAAREVAGANLRTLASLVDKSLLQFSRHEERYGIHQLLRQVGSEKLGEDPAQEATVRDRHSAFYCAALGRWYDDLNRRGKVEATIDINADWANVRAAWEEACRGNVPRLDQAMDGLYRSFWVFSRLEEGAALFRLACDGLTRNRNALTPDGRRVWARALLYCSDLNAEMGRWELADPMIQQSKALLEDQALTTCDTRSERAWLHLMKGRAALHDEPDRTLWHWEQALALHRDLGYEGEVAYRLMNTAVANWNLSQFDRARQIFEESLTLFRAVEDPFGMVVVTKWLGDLARTFRDYGEATERYEAALAVARANGIQWGVASTLGELGFSQFLEGDLQAGVDNLHESAVLWRTLGDRNGLSICLDRLTKALLVGGDLDHAYAHAEENMAIAAAMEASWLLGRALEKRARLDAAAGKYDMARTHARKAIVLSQHDIPLSAFSVSGIHELLGRVALAEGDYAEAGQTLHKVMTALPVSASEAESLEPKAGALATVGQAAHGLGNDEGARQHLIEALEIAIRFRAFDALLQVMSAISVVLAEDTDPQLKQRAVELYALAETQPYVAKSQLFEDIAGRYVKAAIAELPAELVRTARARVRVLDWWETAEELLEELRDLGWAGRDE